ncbi:MAG: histidinol dehydrogenase [Alphaproteobacteria bacterium]
MARRLSTLDEGFKAAFDELVNATRGTAEDVDRAVADILAAVKARGDDAVIEYSLRFDGATLAPQTMAVPAAEVAAARGACDAQTLAALDFAARRIEDYHRRQMPEDTSYDDTTGLRLITRWRPIDAVGVYVPGGTAAYPSSVLMTALPARIAGVGRIVMTVPAPAGKIPPLVLAAAERAGVEEIYRIGGAQAIAALAYGTATIAPVDKIVGPGNAYVAAAKRQVFGTVGIDTIAGPSEVLILADGDNDPAWIAIDLLAQAEHDPCAQAILITDDGAFADRVVAAVEGHLETLERANTAGKSWQDFGAVIIVEELSAAVPLINALAPEHLELAIDDAEALADKVSNAGAIFLGRNAPEAIGDYVAGPNHVLPTSRSARFSSGLGVHDFLKRTAVMRCDAAALAEIGPAAVRLAEAEGLGAHALSVAIRLNIPRKG